MRSNPQYLPPPYKPHPFRNGLLGAVVVLIAAVVFWVIVDAAIR
jgi:hypothetical protein